MVTGRVGLFGGTFNPIHRCHLITAEAVRQAIPLDHVLLVPTGDPPHKPKASLAPAADRLAMVTLAVQGHSSLGVSDVEMTRPGKSYSIDTVRELRRRFKDTVELFFIIGVDAFVELDTWRDARTLLTLCHFVIVGRPGSLFSSLRGMALIREHLPDSLAMLETVGGRLDVPLPYDKRLMLLNLPPCEASASDIRQRLARGLPVSDLLPEPVLSYIMQKKLYQEGADQTGG